MATHKPAPRTVSRRGFLRGGAAAAVGLGAAGALASTGTWLEEARATEEPRERTACTYHLAHCDENCSLKCTTREGRLALLQPADWDDPLDRTICVKGISEIEHVYSDQRIQTPLRRVGERGSGQFEAITWDEAWAEITERLGAVRKTYGPESVLFQCCAETDCTGSIASLMNMEMGFNGGSFTGGGGVDYGNSSGIDPTYGMGFASLVRGHSDFMETKTLLNMGSNVYETDLVHAGYLNDARDAGCTLITVDPNFSTTAAKSDLWIPLNPGTDVALIAGMIREIIAQGWEDRDFMIAHSQMPFLVDAETGAVVRLPATEEDEAVIAAIQEGTPWARHVAGKPLVWDVRSEAAAPHDGEGVEPALEGEYRYEGRTVMPLFEALKRAYDGYDLAWASEVTGVDGETITDVARRFACERPAAFKASNGASDKYSTGDICGHIGALLSTITGNIAVKGGGAGFFSDNFLAGPASLGAWELPEWAVPHIGDIDVYDLPRKENNIHALVSFGEYINRVGNTNLFIDWMKEKLDFVVVAELCFTRGVDYADIVLPMCSKFENTEDVGGAKIVYNRLMLRQKILDPLFDSKPEFEIERGLAACFGLEGHLPATAREYVERLWATGTGLEGLTIDEVVANGGIWDLGKAPYTLFEDNVFGTPSGKAEPYYEFLLEVGQAFPLWEEPNEVGQANPLRERFPLSFVQPRTRFHVHGQFCDASWIQQYYEPCLEMNPLDMEERGIAPGDVVEAYNDRGSFTVKAKASNAVRPGGVRMFEGMWPKYMDGTALQDVTNDFSSAHGYLMWYGPQIPFNDTLVEVRKAGR